MTKRQDVLQHFAAEEKAFVEKILDLCARVEETYAYALTAFLNPREERIVQSLAQHFQLQYFSSREWLETEFVRVILAPSYYQCQTEDFEMVAYRIEYPHKFYQLSHSQILGTLLNRLSIRRDLIGDILVQEGIAHILLDQRFSHLLEIEVAKIGKVPVHWDKVDWKQLSLQQVEIGQEKQVLVSSLRLDKVLATAFGLSRTAAVKLIDSGCVKVDYQETLSPSKLLEEGQMLSVRGFGRVKIGTLLGFSKQGKLKLQMNIIRK